jgi:hypothetical protein
MRRNRAGRLPQRTQALEFLFALFVFMNITRSKNLGPLLCKRKHLGPLINFYSFYFPRTPPLTAPFLPDDKSAIAEDSFSSLGKYSSAELTRQELTLLVAPNRVWR